MSPHSVTPPRSSRAPVDPRGGTRLLLNLGVLSLLCLIMWIVLIADEVSGGDFRYHLGIRGRKAEGLIG